MESDGSEVQTYVKTLSLRENVFSLDPQSLHFTERDPRLSYGSYLNPSPRSDPSGTHRVRVGPLTSIF